jgi:hypothetical protein
MTSPNDVNWLPRRRWPYYLAGMVLALCVIAALLRAGVWWSGEPIESDSETVAREWNTTISRLGLEPIYPPQEDIAVGDIFLIITQDELGALAAPALLGRSIKIWHVDLSKELKDAYRQTFIFPDTPPDSKDGEPWPLQVANGSVFDVVAERPHLPLVLLPGLTLARIREASASGGWISNSLKAIGGARAYGERSVELKIPFAETYGVPALVANGHLYKFCNDQRFKNVCTEKGARGFLSTVVGSIAFEQLQLKDGQKKYRLQIEVMLISRLYLLRSIQNIVHDGNNFGAQVKLADQLNEGLQRLQSASPGQGPPVTTAKDSEDVNALRRLLEEQKKLLESAIGQVSSASSSGNASVQSLDDRRISVTQRLLRPVAFAFRSIRTGLSEK